MSERANTSRGTKRALSASTSARAPKRRDRNSRECICGCTKEFKNEYGFSKREFFQIPPEKRKGLDKDDELLLHVILTELRTSDYKSGLTKYQEKNLLLVTLEAQVLRHM